jgi:hypothetical protein
MLRQTRLFQDAVREEEQPPMLDDRGEVERIDPRDPGSVLMFKIRKKQQLAVLRRMMADAGYPDVARMASLGRAQYDDSPEEDR